VSEDSEPDTHEIACNDVMDISTAADLKSQLVGALESGLPVILDASQAFFHDALAQGQDIQWREPSDALVHSSALLGLSKTLKLENVLH